MTHPRTDDPALLLDGTIGIDELAYACSMSLIELEELVEYGALLPIASPCIEPVFPMASLQPLRMAGKIRRDYDLDLFVVVIVMDYLRRIAELEAQVQGLQAQTGL